MNFEMTKRYIVVVLVILSILLFSFILLTFINPASSSTTNRSLDKYKNEIFQDPFVENPDRLKGKTLDGVAANVDVVRRRDKRSLRLREDAAFVADDRDHQAAATVEETDGSISAAHNDNDDDRRPVVRDEYYNELSDFENDAEFTVDKFLLQQKPEYYSLMPPLSIATTDVDDYADD